MKIISAFPGTGKTYLFTTNKSLRILDSDSSKFPKDGFPENYIQHIKENMSKADLIFISTHEDIRKALHVEGIEFILVFPKRELKQEYLRRYASRGSGEGFVKLLSNSWDEWISQMENEEGCVKIKLEAGQFISDIL